MRGEEGEGLKGVNWGNRVGCFSSSDPILVGIE